MVADQKNSEEGKFVIIRRYEPVRPDKLSVMLRSVYYSWLDSVYNESTEFRITSKNIKASNGKSGHDHPSIHGQTA